MLQIALQTSTVELDGVAYTLREHTAAQVEEFLRRWNVIFDPDKRGDKSVEVALAELLAFILHPPDGAQVPPVDDLVAAVSTRMALAIIDEQARLNSYDDILGNLLRRGTMPAATAAVSPPTL